MLTNGRYGHVVDTGMEAAGIVQEVGTDVTEVKVGDRVCYGGIITLTLVSSTSLTWNFKVLQM